MRWYVLFVNVGEEVNVKKSIKKLLCEDCEVVVPRRKIRETKQRIKREVIKNLFPGYVFIEVDMNAEVYYKIKKIPNVIKILSYDSNYTDVLSKEMDLIFNLITVGEVIELSDAIFVENRLQVLSGPLKNKEQFIKKVDKRKERATVYFNIHGKTQKVDLGLNIIN